MRMDATCIVVNKIYRFYTGQRRLITMRNNRRKAPIELDIHITKHYLFSSTFILFGMHYAGAPIL
jgi:hypothetical protein